MRFIKFFSIAAAVLAVASCNKQIEQPVDGELTEVSVDVVLPGDVMTKAWEDNTDGIDGQGVPVVINTVDVKLYAASGNETVTLNSEDFSAGKATAEFKPCRTPLKVEVLVNGGKEEALTLDEIIDEGLAAKMYASTTHFEYSGEKNEIAKATLNPQHEYARFEISGIEHVDEGGDCIFATINFQGLFLNNFALTEGGEATKYTAWDGENITNITDEAGVPFSVGAKFPTTEGKCYAYNFFVNQKPEIVLAFNNVKGADGAELGTTRYAVIKNFKHGEETIESFEAGKIYRIKSVKVADEYTAPTPEGPVDVTLTAEVTIQDWNIVDTDIEWK